MDFKDIKIWLALAKYRNITQTATTLFISQPALTKRIHKSEEEFNTQLLIREHNGIKFTVDGKKFLRHCRLIDNDYQSMMSDLTSTGDQLKGTLSVAVTSIFARYRLPKLLRTYLKDNPEVALNIRAGRSWNIYPLIKNHEVPIAIIREGYAWGQDKYLLNEDSLCLASLNPINTDQLNKEAFIKYETDPYLNQQMMHWYQEHFATIPENHITASNVDTALAFVSSGLGWSILPQTVLQSFKGYTHKLNWNDGRPFTRATWLYYDHKQLSSPVIRSFVNFMKKSFPDKNTQ